MFLSLYLPFLGDRSFGAAGPRIWNSLPHGLRTLDISYKHFKTLLKTHTSVCLTRPRRLVTFIYRRLRNILTYLLTYFILFRPCPLSSFIHPSVFILFHILSSLYLPSPFWVTLVG